jgi:H+/Cl- antiporter ClcA
MAKVLIIIGLVLVVVGLVLHYAPWVFSWFGRLPGDIRIEREHGRFFLPLTSMVILSVVLTLLLSLFRR